MLLEFKCSNYKSIKEEICFSMVAGSDNTFQNRLMRFGKCNISRSSIIYGANGSGKSNFINSLAFMKDLVVNSIKNQPGTSIFQPRHKLSEEGTPSNFSIQFVKDNVRYAYGFSVKENYVLDEYLYFFPKGRKVRIFERDKLNVKPGNKYKNVFDVSISILKENRLFLSCAANYSNVKEIEDTFMFFNSDIVIYNPEINNWFEYSAETLQNNYKVKELFIDILQAFGTGIEDVRVKIGKVKLDDLPNDVQIPDIFKDIIGSQEVNELDAKIKYNQFETDLMSEESMGIQQLFQMICPIIDILNNNKILICDELENHLHESIIYQIICLFQLYNREKSSQLIFSTHNTNLLDAGLFRRDQIWFTQLNQERATDLYSLAEIKDIRKTEKYGRQYLLGKYGAIPLLNRQFFEDLYKNGKDGGTE